MQIAHAPTHARQLPKLDQVQQPTPWDMNLPGWRLHPLHGDLAGIWSVSANDNWRMAFTFGDAKTLKPAPSIEFASPPKRLRRAPMQGFATTEPLLPAAITARCLATIQQSH